MSPASSEEPRVVLALAPWEVEQFLAEPVFGEIKQLFPGLQIYDPQQTDREDWVTMLNRVQPEILVTCWNTPRLPDTLPASLRYVCHLGGTLRGLMPRQHLERGLIVTNWGGSIARTVAEGALTLTLASLRKLDMWHVRMKEEGGWKQVSDRVESLFERRVGIYGFGLIARELVRLMAPFGNTISVHAPVPDELLAKFGAKRAPSFDALFAENDIVIVLAPLVPETRGSVTERHLRLIPEGGLFVNVARGAIVDEPGLIKVAQEGRLQIALDVYHNEPLPADWPLRRCKNVTMTPHVSGPTEDRRRDVGALALKHLRAYREGRPIEAAITPAIYDAST